MSLPPLLPRKPLVQQRQDLWNIELDIFKIKRFLAVLLHLKQVIELEV